MANTIAYVCCLWRLIHSKSDFWPYIASMRLNPVRLSYATQAELARTRPLNLQFIIAFSSQVLAKSFR